MILLGLKKGTTTAELNGKLVNPFKQKEIKPKEIKPKEIKPKEIKPKENQSSSSSDIKQIICDSYFCQITNLFKSYFDSFMKTIYGIENNAVSALF